MPPDSRLSPVVVVSVVRVDEEDVGDLDDLALRLLEDELDAGPAVAAEVVVGAAVHVAFQALQGVRVLVLGMVVARAVLYHVPGWRKGNAYIVVRFRKVKKSITIRIRS